MKKIERPRFELARVYSDGRRDAPEVIPVGQMPWDTKMERRGFLGVGVGFAALLFLLDGKAEAKGFEQWEKFENSVQDDISAKAPDESISAHLYAIKGLAVSANSKTLISLGDDGFLKTWSLPSGRFLLRKKIITDEDFAYALALAPNNKSVFVSYSLDLLKAYSFPGLAVLGKFKGLEEYEEFDLLTVSPDSRILAAVTESNEIKLWSLPTRRFIKTLEGHAASINKIVISPDGVTLASASADKTIKLWSLTDFSLLATLEGHTAGVETLNITGDGRQLISGSTDKTIKIWSLPERKLITSISVIEETIEDSALNPDDRLFTTNNSGKFINMWSLPAGKNLTKFEAHTTGGMEMAVTPDGKFLISGHSDGVISLWDLEKRSFRTFLFDRAANDPDTKGISYNVFDKISKQTITFTLPCGSPIPKGAVCTCNCVSGTYREPEDSGDGGTYCTCNKICTCIPVPSDRDAKEAFENTDSMTILQRLSEIPIQKWNYKWDDDSIRHIGPTAQDFAAAFAVGDSDKHIHPVDAQGVAFAAIQGLYQIMKAKDTGIESLQSQLENQQTEKLKLEARIEALEQLIKAKMKPGKVMNFKRETPC